MVFNKIDAYTAPEIDNLVDVDEQKEPLTLADFKKTWMAHNNAPAIFISATLKENLEEFRQLLYDRVKDIHTTRYPYDKLLY